MTQRAFSSPHSSNVTGAVYYEDRQEMEVTFSGGGRYLVEQVPVSTYEAFERAPSKGGFYSARIKPNHAVRRLS